MVVFSRAIRFLDFPSAVQRKEDVRAVVQCTRELECLKVYMLSYVKENVVLLRASKKQWTH